MLSIRKIVKTPIAYFGLNQLNRYGIKCGQIMKVVPQLLYQHKNVKKIMVDGLSCIVHKTIDTIDTQMDHYVASHVLSVVLKGELHIKRILKANNFLPPKTK